MQKVPHRLIGDFPDSFVRLSTTRRAIPPFSLSAHAEALSLCLLPMQIDTERSVAS